MKNPDKDRVIKRLEVIRHLINLEELEGVEEQLQKLQVYEDDDHLHSIVVAIRTKAFGKAVKLIEMYIQDAAAIVTYVDPEISVLKIEIRLLEEEVSVLSVEKAELEKLLADFEQRYYAEVGNLVERLLWLRKEKAAKEATEDATKQRAYQEATDDYEEFYQQSVFIKATPHPYLSEEDQKTLKEAYRKASKLCHPDVVEERQKEAAKTTFQSLSSAYAENDIQEVLRILDSLEHGEGFQSSVEIMDEVIVLRQEAGRLRQVIQVLRSEIEEIKESDTYRTLVEIKDMDAYFEELKGSLKQQIEILEGVDGE